ncbi:hypothetical protein, partial [Barnesiella intestinihominis]|uniref:hypothetical protein n=1 Tax=Barnesiella intestinihominis TaxID=487174 RepID=UPI003AF45C05
CASGRVGSRQLIGERAGEGESPSAFSLFVYRTHNEARQERHMNAPQSHIVSMITPLPLYRNAEQERSAKPLGNECREE